MKNSTVAECKTFQFFVRRLSKRLCHAILQMQNCLYEDTKERFVSLKAEERTYQEQNAAYQIRIDNNVSMRRCSDIFFSDQTAKS